MNKNEEKLGKSQDLIDEYKQTLNEIEKKALEIAVKNLETSFCIEKSVGYLEFISSRKETDG
jgi:hypothetical protein